VTRPRSLSGIKPTGMPHIGNYLGMIRPAVALQEDHDAFYFVADYHALTSTWDEAAMRAHSYDITAIFLAFGLDPARATFWRQSDVPEVCELTWVLSCMTSMGLLERAHAYKAAKDKGEEGAINHGVFAYPVLMAADILLYDSDVVPVGKDQVQHIEMCRDMAQRFNNVFGETLKLPAAKVKEDVATVIGTDGQKMSKSRNNTIPVFLPSKQLRKACMAIVTDSTPMEAPKNPDTCNVFALYRLFATAAQADEMAERYRAGNYGYGHSKQALFEVMDAHLGPYRDRWESLRPDEATLEDILQDGARRARDVGLAVLDRVRGAIGFRSSSWTRMQPPA
jgi:tryptophanyl-tRNA synthetase